MDEAGDGELANPAVCRLHPQDVAGPFSEHPDGRPLEQHLPEGGSARPALGADDVHADLVQGRDDGELQVAPLFPAYLHPDADAAASLRRFHPGNPLNDLHEVPVERVGMEHRARRVDRAVPFGHRPGEEDVRPGDQPHGEDAHGDGQDSSATNKGGSLAKARAIATRCCCPPETAEGSLCAWSAISTYRSGCVARSFRSRGGYVPQKSMGSITFSRSVRVGRS